MKKNNSALISLLTDYGTKDGYAAVIKGVILRINPKVQIVDISHEVPPQDIMAASFILFSSYKYFPKGTIHVAIVDPEVGSKRKIICVKAGGYFFIVPDNGIISLISDVEKTEEIVHVTNSDYLLYPLSNTFHGRDIFAPVAAHLSMGIGMGKLGERIEYADVKRINIPKPDIYRNYKLKGQIIHIDKFGNLITNIPQNLFINFRKNQSVKTFKIKIGKLTINRLSKTYSDNKSGEILVLFGSSNLLEISVNRGNAHKELRLNKRDKVEISLL